MDYSEEDLLEYIKEASANGKVDSVKYYQSQLDRIRNEKEAANG